MKTTAAATTVVRSAAPAAALARGRSRRKRFLIVSVAALAVLAVTMGVSFLDQSGATTLTVNAASGGNLVYTSSLPSGVTAKYSSAPSWSPTANSAGSVATSGSIAVIDASQVSTNVIVNVYITNLASLAQAYSSFAFPIDVWTSTNGSSWSQSSVVSTSPFSSYLTDTSGVISFSLPPNAYYDITMEGSDDATIGGGSFYCISTSNGSLSPSFYVTANAT